MSAISDILDKIDELKSLSESLSERRSSFEEKQLEIREALSSIDEQEKYVSEKIEMLSMIITAIKNESEAHITLAQSFFNVITELDCDTHKFQQQFIDFMRAIGINMADIRDQPPLSGP